MVNFNHIKSAHDRISNYIHNTPVLTCEIINEEMKVAAAHSIAALAREDVPDEVAAAMGGERPHYGKNR